jgi:hypothetical protein
LSETASGEVCVVNIGPAQRRRRRSLGIVSLVAGTVLALTAWALALPPLTRLSAVVFFFGGFNGVFQARAKT